MVKMKTKAKYSVKMKSRNCTGQVLVIADHKQRRHWKKLPDQLTNAVFSL